MFEFKADQSNIRNINISETDGGAFVQLDLSDDQEIADSQEFVSLLVHIDYLKSNYAAVESVKNSALERAKEAIEHEISICRTRKEAML